LLVARREYVETIKTKFFLISLFLTPVFVVGIVFITHFMQKHVQEGARPPKTVAVADMTGALGQDIEEAFKTYNAKHAQRPVNLQMYGPEAEKQLDEFKDKIRNGKLDGCMVIAQDVLEKGGTSRFFMKSDKLADIDVFFAIQEILNNVVVARRLRAHNVSPELFEAIRRPVPLVQMDVMADVERHGPDPLRMIGPFFFLFVMFMGLFGTGQGMLTSVIEEKNSRVIETLLSSLTPFQLMAGKIAGLAAIGLTVVSLWGAAAYAGAASQGLAHIIDVSNLGYLLCYFLLGFLLFSSLYAAVGASCNTLKEAQALLTPLMLITIVPMVTWFYIAQEPNGVFARVLSYFPLTTPMVMPLRLAAEANLPAVEIVLSLVLLAVSVPLVMWAAAKVFRTGILMYGKPATMRELLRWIRDH
jgi:ABC-2 type transport system permease protein